MTDISARTPLWVAARHLLRERGEDFFRRRRRVTERWDAEEIHDLRVASRRLREALALFAPCYDPAPLRRMEKRIKRVTRLLGEIRNSDEASLFFANLADRVEGSDRDETVRLKLSLEDRRREALTELTAELPGIIPKSLHARYLMLVNYPRLFDVSPSEPGPFTPLAPFARRALQERLAPVRALLADAAQEEAEAAQHQLRIAIKHLRYRMELLAPLLGSGYGERHETLKSYQELLGRLHDLSVFRELILGGEFPAANGERVAAVIDAMRRETFATFAPRPAAAFFTHLADEVDHL